MPFPLDIAKILVGWLYWHLQLQQVKVELSNLTARRNAFNNEADAFVLALRKALAGPGGGDHPGSGEGPGLYGAFLRDSMLQGAANRRHENVAKAL